MKAHVLYVIFIFRLFLIPEMIDADWNVSVTLNTGNRPALPPGFTLFPTYPDSGDAGVCALGPYKNIHSKHTYAKNNYDERSSDGHYISFSHYDAGLKIMYSLIQKLAACFIQYVFIGLSGLTLHVHFCENLFKIVVPGHLTYSDNYRFSHLARAFEGGNNSNQHNMTLWESESKYDHQSIVIMEEDQVVMESATKLFEKHRTLSTLMMYQKGTFHVLGGINRRLTRKSHVILVGHGSKDNKGVAKLGGYGPEELAKVVSTIKTENGHLQTISVISCNLGNDLHFVMSLLQALRSFNMETKLHLHNSLLSVTPNGEIVTKDNGVWRYHDSSSTVIAELDRNGNLLTTVELGHRGQLIPDYQGKALYFQTLEWPSHPQMFVPGELRKKYTSIDCLEGLTWSLFFEENERRRAPDYVPEDNQKHLKAIWLTEPNAENVIIKHITTILDLLMEIRYNAREEAESDLYYVLNECIYKVQRTTFNVTLAGRFIDASNQDAVNNFLNSFNDQKDQSSLQELREGLKGSKFNDFCRQTFQLRQCSYNCERWGHYFMAAVFSTSVRNFRTFSLFLMSVIGCEVGRSQGTESTLCMAFVGDDHPMVSDDAWSGQPRRGFYGCTVESFEMARQERLVWLDQVVAKENALYIKSKKMMSDVNHDQQTELDIFGRVKVMNKYVFSSYLEFFRGTPEGRKLKRGCMTSSWENSN